MEKIIQMIVSSISSVISNISVMGSNVIAPLVSNENTFALFSHTHVMYVVIYTALLIGAMVVTNVVKDKLKFARWIALITLIIKILETLYRHHYLLEPYTSLLPLHLCNMSMVLAIILMLYNSYFLFEIFYFWTGGAIFAILTPEINVAFPNIFNISFFVTHYYLFFVIYFCIKHLGYRPTKMSLIKSYSALVLSLPIVYKINDILGTNYIYINYKPPFDSPLNYLGPWPVYIFAVLGITLTVFILMYLPFMSGSNGDASNKRLGSKRVIKNI